MKYLYRPDHPQADEFGMVPADIAYDEPKAWVTSVITDTMQPLRHMGSGRMIDSKAKFRADTKATGCVEIGNESVRTRTPIRLDKRERREAIKRTIYELRNS